MNAFCASGTLPRSGISFGTTSICVQPTRIATVTPVYAPGEIRAAKHVQKKATKKHMDRRPKKKRPSDIHRKPPPYDVDPLNAPNMPAEYTVLGFLDEEPAATEVVATAEVAATTDAADVSTPATTAAPVAATGSE